MDEKNPAVRSEQYATDAYGIISTAFSICAEI